MNPWITGRSAHSRVLFVLIGLAGAAAWPGSPAFACACCVSPGHRYEGTRALTSFELAEFALAEFTATAGLYVTEAGFEDVKGIKPPADRYRLKVERGARWVLRFTDDNGRTGTLSLPQPKTATFFEVDRRGPAPGEDRADEEEEPKGRNPKLYKEFRLTGAVDGTGIFADGAKGAKATLILQGGGNHCMSATDLTHWTLEVKGPRARYTLLGRFRSAAKQE